MASKIVLIIKWKPQGQGEPSNYSFIYPPHPLFAQGLFKVIITSPVMEDYGQLCGHMWKILYIHIKCACGLP